MTEFLDALIRAFRKAPRRPAVFDTGIRQHVGLWTLDDPIPTHEIFEAFAEHPAFEHASFIVIPLHEADSPELTGEYVEYRGSSRPPSVRFYDFSRNDFIGIPVDDFERSYPAWRIRYWHPDYSSATTPSFLYETAETSETVDPIEETVDVEPDSGRGDELFRELRMFVEAEREAEREKHREMFERLSVDTYLREMAGIPHLTSDGFDVDEYGQQAVILRLHSPDGHDGYPDPMDFAEEFGVHADNEVLVDVRRSDEASPVEAKVLGSGARHVELGVYWNRISSVTSAEEVFTSPEDRVFCLGELLNPVPFDRELEAVNAIEDSDRKRAILVGTVSPGFEESRSQSLRKARLNSFQYQAAQQSIRAEDIYCIHGPPGTGKTRTLVEIISALAKEGYRILASAHSNQAVDNLLVGDSTDEHVDRSSLHYAVQEGDLTVARVGENTTNPLVEEHYLGNDRYQSDVVCATTSGAARFGEDIFDYAVIDEATQASIPASAIPFSRAETTILAGDHRQLPPYYSSERAETESLEISMFEELLDRFGGGIKTTLRTQYRMNEAIAAFPNETFYGGELKHGSQNRTWTAGPLDPLEAYDVRGGEQQTPSNSYYNETEAELVASEVQQLLDTGITTGEIGIITPYSGQVGKIRSGLDSVTGDTGGIEIATVDAFQGSEREVIVVSFVRSNEHGYSGFLTFPEEGPRRLNVAMTRAKRRLVLVGDFTTLGTCGPDKHPDQSAAGVYADLKAHLERQGAITTLP